MNKLLTLITVCICCISILGLKLRLDIYVHDKNEVITTMANNSNEDEFVYDPNKYDWWDIYVSGKAEADRLKAERAMQQAQRERLKNREDILNAIADQIKANLERGYRTKADDMDLVYLGLLQNGLINRNIRQRLIDDLGPRYNESPNMSGMFKPYFEDGGKNLDGILENILIFIEPLIVKREGVIDPINYPEDIQKRLADFYNKIWRIYDSGKLDESGNPKESLEDRINQFKAVMDSPDFAEFYGDAPIKGKEVLGNLTGKYVPCLDEYQQQSEEEQKAAYQQYLKNLNDSEYTVPTQEPATNEDPVPNAKTILGITGYQENQENQENSENQEGEVVEAPEGGETSYTPIPTTDDVDALLSSSLTGPSYALNTTPGLYGDKYEALAKALRAYALKNGIVTDTPKDPESFKPYIPDFYV